MKKEGKKRRYFLCLIINIMLKTTHKANKLRNNKDLRYKLKKLRSNKRNSYSTTVSLPIHGSLFT